QDFGMCNSLAVFAPEIKNDWAMTLVPGTRREDGTIDHSVNCGGTCAYIFSKCEDKESSWKFLKWWVSGKTQSSYATQIEILLGEHARYNVASISAFENQMWTRQQAEILSEQREWSKGIPQVPGSYFVSRHLNNAFRKVVYNSADVRETLNEYTEIINKELSNKRREFGLGEN
ncbi:MAG TPA: ABC transporter substrate-binding protein, partial [Candidatus Avimonas sp.]|nr:ABC transporter substrate-binding protein [Candidatus Avimonas sp.]